MIFTLRPSYGDTTVKIPGGGTIVVKTPPASTPPIAPAPTPPRVVIPGGGAIIVKPTQAQIDAAIAMLLEAAPFPGDLSLNSILGWVSQVRSVAATRSDLSAALAVINAAFPPTPDGSGGLFGAIKKVVDTVKNVVGNVLPSPAEYDPENLIVTGLTNPVRFAVLMTAATLVAPGLGSTYVSGFTLPAAPTVGFPLAVAKAYARGGWDRVQQKILEPIVREIGDRAKFLVDYAINGNSAIARWGVKKVALNLGESVAKAVLLAISESTQIIDALRDPSQLKEQGTITTLGELIQKIGLSGAVGQGTIRDGAIAVGEAVKTMAEPLSILLKRGAEGLKDAIDAAARKVLGFTPSEILALPAEARAQVAQVKLKAQSTFNLNVVGSISDAVNDIASALERLPWVAGKFFRDLLGPVKQMASEVERFVADMKKLAAGGAPSLPSLPSPSTPPPASPAPGAPSGPIRIPGAGTIIVKPPSSAPAPKPPPPSTQPAPAPPAPNPGVVPPSAPAPAGSGRLLKMGAGAGGGFLVGGPAGALVGAIVGAIL